MSRYPFIHNAEPFRPEVRKALTDVAAVRRALGVQDYEDLPERAEGGYPILYLDRDGLVLCGDCAQRSIDDLLDGGDPAACPTEFIVFYEGDPEFCYDCGVEIDSAYGGE